jgi:hypothetical protein
MLLISSHLRLGLPSSSCPSGCPTKTLYAPFLSPKRATCPAHLILLDLINRRIFSEDYISLSSSLCSYLLPLRLKYYHQNLILRRLQSTFLPQHTRPSFTPYKTTDMIISLSWYKCNQILKYKKFFCF